MIQQINKLFYDDNYIVYSQINQTSFTKPGIVFIHGLMSDMEGSKALAIKQYCIDKNICFTRFDFYGHGRSSGNFIDGNITKWKNDCLLILDKLCKTPQILVGSSMGGWVMLLAALERPKKIHALLGIAAAPDFTKNLFWDKLDSSEKKKFKNDNIYVKKSNDLKNQYKIKYQLIEDGSKNLLLSKEIAINCKVTLLHGMEDTEVPYHTSIKVAEKLMSKNVEVHLVKNSNHRFSSNDDIKLIKQELDKLIELQ